MITISRQATLIFALKLLKIFLSALCALCALLAMVSVVSVWVLLIVIGLYVGAAFLTEKFSPTVIARPRAARRRKQQSASPPAAQPSARSLAIFGTITGLTPMLFLVVLELGLRVIGFNNSYPLFIDSPGAPGYMQVNPDVVKRFLVQESPASAMQADTIFFLKDKPADTYRIFVLGESSAAGFPYGRFGSLAGMLEQRLRRTFPDKNIEVITTAMSAVNSYTLLDFTDEILAQKPDAVLIYTGHNEYVGILGVGSAYSVSTSRDTTLAFLKLRQLRLFQIVKDTYYSFSVGNLAKASSRNVMAEIARDKEIPYGSATFDAGVAQFRDNLDDMLSRYEQAHVPVLIGTLVSNERDQAPFVSKVGPGVDPALWEQVYQQGYSAIKNKDWPAAQAAFARDLSMDDIAADAYYAQAYVYESEKNYEAARQDYLAAKDRDQLRFRAPEVFNDVIRQEAQKHGAILVDVQAAFHREAVNGIIGTDLILEHVHPNAYGYFVLTDAYYEALRQHSMIGSWEHAISKEQAWQEVPLTDVDMLYAKYKVQQLTSAYPFKQTDTTPSVPPPTNLIEQLAQGRYYGTSQWLGDMLQLLQYYQDQKDTANVTKVALILADAVPFYADYQSLAGRQLVEAGKADQALPYLRQAVQINPANTSALFDLAKAYSLAGKPDLARATLTELLRIDPNNQPALDLLKTLGS